MPELWIGILVVAVIFSGVAFHLALLRKEKELNYEKYRAEKTAHKEVVREFFRALERELAKNGIEFIYDSMYRSGFLPSISGCSSVRPCGVYLEVWPDHLSDKLQFALVNRKVNSKGSPEEKAADLLHEAIFRKLQRGTHSLFVMAFDFGISVFEIKEFGSSAVAVAVAARMQVYERLWSETFPIYWHPLEKSFRDLASCEESIRAWRKLLLDEQKTSVA